MQALHDVVKAGYVRYLGMSSCFAYQCQSRHINRLLMNLIVWKSSPCYAEYVSRSAKGHRLAEELSRLRYRQPFDAFYLHAESLLVDLP